ncbi:ribosomal-protein-alanine acetyltransferase [Maritimibacter sp. 55A14]|nr:ribosomal-protein-alanine acetyltransferase [Maritimibacter sp. 55A14]
MARLHAAAFTTPRPWSAPEFASLLAERSTVFCGGEAGFALGRVVAGEAELLTIAVARDLRRAGRGQTLLAEFEALAAAKGAAEIFLEVAEDNAPARALYARMGYRGAGRRAGYYRRPDGRPLDALVLRKSFASG